MAAASSSSRPAGQGDVFYVPANPRRLSMGLDLQSTGQVQQIMQGPLGVDVDNDGEVDVVITPEKLLEFALDHGSAVSAAGQNAVRETRRSSLALSASSHVESLLPKSARRPSVVSSASSQPPPPPQQQPQRASIRLPPTIVVAPPVYVDSFDPPAPPTKPAPIPVPVEVATPTPSVVSQQAPPPQPRAWQPPPLPRPLGPPRWAQRPSGIPLQDLENLPSNVTYSIVQRKIAPDYGPRLFPYQDPQGDCRADFYEWHPQSHD